MKKSIVIGLVTFLLGLISTDVYAHYFWINVDNYNPKPGEEITISIGYGHKFPEDSEPSASMVSQLKLYLVDPNKKIMPLKIKAKDEKGVEYIKVRLEKPGTYLVVLTKAGFVCKTTKGYFYESKKKLKNVLESKWSEEVAKALVHVGSPVGDTFQEKIEQRYQIIPLQDPGKLKKGDYLPLKVVLDDETHRTWMYATYVGFSEESDTFCYVTRANKEGIAKIRIIKPGIWLIKTSDELPYPNPKEADIYSFTSTLTFEMK